MTDDQAQFLRELRAEPLTEERWRALVLRWADRVNVEPLAVIGDANGWQPPAPALG